ncbi:MAG: tetratricopeptide repeat protein [Magnetococcus sp. WYHC-3]
MAQSRWIVEVDESRFNQLVSQSMTIPVLVDFWAPWCQPCRTLGPILEKLAVEMQGAFLLAKVNSDENRKLATALGVRGIPACKLILGGQVVDEFSGALPESEVRRFLARNIPSPSDRLVDQGHAFLEDGREEDAVAAFNEALHLDPKHDDALTALAGVALARGDKVTARTLLERLSPEGRDGEIARSLRAKLSFEGAGTDLTPLEHAVTANPRDVAARLALGKALIPHERYAEAMDHYLEALRLDRAYDEQAARKAMIQVFDMLGPTHPLTRQYRTKLSALLFS